MYEVDFTGHTRTPEDLKKLKENKLYRLKRNFERLYKAIKYDRLYWDSYFDWRLITNVLTNANTF